MADPTRVDIPGVGVVEFPDSMSPEAVNAAAKRLHDEAQPSLGRRLASGALDTLPAIGGMVGAAFSTPETLGVGTIPGIALGTGAGKGLRDLIGHATGLDAPSTPTDKAIGIVGDTALAGTAAAVLPGVAAAVKAPMQTLREGAEQFGSAMPPWVRRLGRLIPTAGQKAPEPILTRPPWQTWPEAAPAEAPAAAAPTAETFSATERAGLAKQYGPKTLAQIDARLALKPMPSHATASAPVPSHEPLPNTADAPVLQRIERPDLKQPRLDVGAEKVGRGVGQTKEQIRQQTGPVLDEQLGDASPILPQKALERIIDTMRELPKGGPEREAYVARATAGKTKNQVENIRRTLEYLKLIVPAAVTAREAMTGMLRDDQ